MSHTKFEKEDIDNIWIQEDGAIYYSAKATVYVLRPIFKDHIICLRDDVEIRILRKYNSSFLTLTITGHTDLVKDTTF